MMRKLPQILGVITAATVLVVGLLLILGGESPETAASKWLTALVQKDVETLTELSVADGISDESMEEQWTYMAEVAAPHYEWAWAILSTERISDDRAAVRIEALRSASLTSSFAEYFGFQLQRGEDGVWRVDLRTVAREMHPALPR